MDSGHDRMSMDAEGDRLSILPDDLILKILSFVDLKDAIRTSVLSHRWRYLWTSLPHLTFSSEYFSTLDKFSRFVTNVLSRRDNHAKLSFLELYLRLKDGYDVVRRIMNCAFSHNVHQLKLSCLFGKNTTLSLPSSQTLKHLYFSSIYVRERIALTFTAELSSLTTLRLDFISLYDTFFSKCPNLENLTLICCRMLGSASYRIFHRRLSNLMINYGDLLADTLNVVTPQLKKLNITQLHGRYLISAPELASLVLRGFASFTFRTDGLNSLEKAHLSLYRLSSKDAPNIISLLQDLHNVQDLSLSVDIIQFLNSEVELISHQPSLFANLKNLKILPRSLRCMRKGEHVKVVMATEVKNYLLNSSPEATLTKVYT